MILNSDSRKPKIEYPCEWNYKVIGSDVEKILTAIEEASMGLNYDVTPSNISRKGNYYSLNFTLQVPNEVVRDLVYEKLQKYTFIKFIL